MKKTIISLLLVAVLAFGAGFGTLAYYTSTFTSEGNSIVTSKFNPTDNETFDDEFTIGEGTFHPDSAISKLYQVNLSDVEVAVEYLINIENTGDLFGQIINESSVEVTPININLVIKDLDEKNNIIGSMEFDQNAINNLVEEYIPTLGTAKSELYLSYIWPESTTGIDDKAFAAKGGNVLFNLEVRQITGKGDLASYADGKAFVSAGDSYFNINNNHGISFGNLGSNKVRDIKLALYNTNNELIGMLSLTNNGKEITNANTSGITTISVDCIYNSSTGFTNNDPLNWFITDNTSEISDKNVNDYAWLFTLEGPDAGIYEFTK